MIKKLENNVYGPLFFFGLSLLVLLIYKLIIPTPIKLEKKLTLSEIPKYGHYSTKGKNSRTVYYIELAFTEMSSHFQASSLHFNYFEHFKFKNEVKIGDTLKVVSIDNEIIELYKNGYNYIDSESCILYHENELTLITIEFTIGFLISVLILTSKKFIKTKNYLLLLKYSGIFLIILLVIFWFIIKQYLNFEVHDNDWMKYPIKLNE